MTDNLILSTKSLTHFKETTMENNAPMTREDHWSRPVAMAPDGQWISLREVVDEEPARFSFIQLTPEQAIKIGCGTHSTTPQI